MAATAGVAAASVFSGSPSSAPSPASGPGTMHKADDSTDHEGDAVHGGPIDRFHQSSPCDLTPISSLPGNWTHGDYVSAVAAGGDTTQIQQAAHSDCGKPLPAIGHGGPPAFAQQHIGGHADDRHIFGSGRPTAGASETPGD